jgi:hypothetical protein
MRWSTRAATIVAMLDSTRIAEHAYGAMTRAVRFVLRSGAWLEEQIWPPRGRGGTTPARITVLTNDGPQTLAQRSRRA